MMASPKYMGIKEKYARKSAAFLSYWINTFIENAYFMLACPPAFWRDKDM